MQANYEILKDTIIGKFLGCAVPQVLKAKLAAGEPTEIDMSNLEIKITVEGVELDLHRLFGAFERSVPQQQTSVADDDILSRLESLRDDLSSAENRLSENCTDAINAASSSYYCGEYASDSANEAGHEYHPGSECLEEEISDLDSIIESVRELNNRSEAA